jgi:hypothetical protein
VRARNPSTDRDGWLSPRVDGRIINPTTDSTTVSPCQSAGSGGAVGSEMNDDGPSVAARSTRASPPKKDWSKSSIRWTPSVSAASPSSRARPPKAGSVSPSETEFLYWELPGRTVPVTSMPNRGLQPRRPRGSAGSAGPRGGDAYAAPPRRAGALGPRGARGRHLSALRATCRCLTPYPCQKRRRRRPSPR